MSKSENILAFEAALKENKELREKYEAAQKRIIENKEAESDGEVLVKAAAEVGFTLTPEELERAMAQYQELNDEELGNVAGGAGGDWCSAMYYCFMVYENGNEPETPCKSNYECFFFEN